jgi:energy-coupling factor transport system substrate-specific component
MTGSRAVTTSSRALNGAILVLVSLIGVVAFTYPFFQPLAVRGGGMGASAHAQDALLLFVALIVLCLGAVLSSMSSSGGLNSKMIAALGILTAVNAVLRLVPGPMGFSFTFALPILAGYCYGSTFGFLLGALSLAVAALLGAGVGPWLPYQMYTIGWVGLTSAWLPDLRRRSKLEIGVLCLWGLVWGMAFGFIMNLWFWPFIYDPTQGSMYWEPGTGVTEAVRRYLLFYAITSSWWDAVRAVGNVVLIALFGIPVLRLLRRFGRRFTFEVRGEGRRTAWSSRDPGRPGTGRPEGYR